MKRLEALQLASGTIPAFAMQAGAVPRPAASLTTLPYLAFGVAIGSRRGIGVLFQQPILVVQDDEGHETRAIIPRGAFGVPRRWTTSPQPEHPPATDVQSAPGNDVRYGRILDEPTAMCRAAHGAYVALVAFPSLPYLAHYDPDRQVFMTYRLPQGPRIMVLFERSDRLYYVVAGNTELASVEAAPIG